MPLLSKSMLRSPTCSNDLSLIGNYLVEYDGENSEVQKMSLFYGAFKDGDMDPNSTEEK